VSLKIVTLQNFLHGEALLALSEAPGTGYLQRLVDDAWSITQCTTCFNTNSAICLQCIYGFSLIITTYIHYFTKYYYPTRLCNGEARVFRQLELQFQTLLRRVSCFDDYLSHSDLVLHKTITSTHIYKMIASYPFQSPYIKNPVPLTNDE
jgi:hypothetical protein